MAKLSRDYGDAIRVDALTVTSFVVVHGVRERDRVKPRPPPSKLPPVDIVNWSIPEYKTPTWHGERKCGRRKGTSESIDKQNKGLALLLGFWTFAQLQMALASIQD
jgi:hypothetical protein